MKNWILFIELRTESTYSGIKYFIFHEFVIPVNDPLNQWQASLLLLSLVLYVQCTTMYNFNYNRRNTIQIRLGIIIRHVGIFIFYMDITIFQVVAFHNNKNANWILNVDQIRFCGFELNSKLDFGFISFYFGKCYIHFCGSI